MVCSQIYGNFQNSEIIYYVRTFKEFIYFVFKRAVSLCRLQNVFYVYRDTNVLPSLIIFFSFHCTFSGSKSSSGEWSHGLHTSSCWTGFNKIESVQNSLIFCNSLCIGHKTPHYDHNTHTIYELELMTFKSLYLIVINICLTKNSL